MFCFTRYCRDNIPGEVENVFTTVLHFLSELDVFCRRYEKIIPAYCFLNISQCGINNHSFIYTLCWHLFQAS